MKKTAVILFLFIIFYTLSLNAKPINFTQEEKNFIKNNPVIEVSMMNDFTPFTYVVDGKVVGYEHDLLKLISKKTSLKFEKTIGPWTKVFNAFKNKQTDMITTISYKEERTPFTKYTSSYYDIPIMVFVRDDFEGYKNLDSLSGKKVGVLKDVFYSKELQELKKFDTVVHSSYEELTKALVFGKIDALIQNLTNINYIIKKNAYSNIKLAGEFTLPSIKREDLRIGVNPQKPILHSIIQKGLNAITVEEKNALVNKWIGSIKEYGQGKHIDINEDEIAYLDKNTINYCIDPNLMPYEGLSSDGKHTGMSADYLKIMQTIAPLKFSLVKTDSWNQSLEYIENKKCDLIFLIAKTKSRESYLEFTKPYLKSSLVFATKIDAPFISQVEDLSNKKVAITKGYSTVEILKQKYPFLQIIEVKDIDEGLKKLKNDEVYAYIDALASISYKIQTQHNRELKIAAKVPVDLDLTIAVRNDAPTLYAIMNKIIDNISDTQHRNIFNKWVAVKYEKGIDYELVWKVLAVSGLIFILFIYWNRKITTSNNLLKEAHKEIENKNKELQRVATTDKLTSVYNRAKIDEVLQTEIKRAKRLNNIFSVALLDIDYFKAVNDTYGHQAGDKVLQEFAEILKNNTREIDYIGRYGGEEFLIIYPETDKEKLLLLAKSLKEKIQNYEFSIVKHKTCSLGVSTYTQGDSLESIVKRADLALYEAKNGGRNTVVYK